MIFLSASIPDPVRNEKYFGTADVIAIRDAVRALATVVIPKSNLIWGGHPAITPLIRYVMSAFDANVQNHITLYQSNYFIDKFPADNSFFEKVIFTKDEGSREDSLREMRFRMINDNKYDAGVFIGGMEGVEEEYEMFHIVHPRANIFPMASTGGAAKYIYEKSRLIPDLRFVSDYAYLSLFRTLFESIIK